MEKTDTPLFYSNMAHVIVSNKDFVILFGVLVPEANITAEEKVGKIENTFDSQARIYMSPPQFKALTKVMEGQLKEYESRFGEIIDTLEKTPKT